MYDVLLLRFLRRKPVEYKETIEPTTIARRLMEIREQMAQQLSTDLRQMAAENARLKRDYTAEVGCVFQEPRAKLDSDQSQSGAVRPSISQQSHLKSNSAFPSYI